MDKQVLTSVPSTNRQGRYAVGVLKDGMSICHYMNNN